jgi:HPt (histidine-containing phosphotransfer) domain-containing protein
MAEPALKTTKPNASPEPIDRAHLARMTFGEISLERELLQLFDRQCEVLVSRMRDADAGAVKVLAHTLKGSASGIGAWAVKDAAMALEFAAATSVREQALNGLAAAVAEARAAAQAILGADA